MLSWKLNYLPIKTWKKVYLRKMFHGILTIYQLKHGKQNKPQIKYNTEQDKYLNFLAYFIGNCDLLINKYTASV